MTFPSLQSNLLIGLLLISVLHAQEPTPTPTPAPAELFLSPLDSFHRDATPGTHTAVLDNGFVLYGNLFKTRQTYALISTGNSVGFAKLVAGQWQLKGQWPIGCVFRPADWKFGEGGYLPIRPATIPFQLQDFNGDGIPEVIIAGEVGTYYQIYYLYRFDPQMETLINLGRAMGKPELDGGYVRLYYNSGYLAIFGEWRFMAFPGDKLEEIAMWHNGTPYNPGTDEGPRAAWRNKKGELRFCKWNSGLQEIRYDSPYILETSDGKPLATVEFSRKKQLTRSEQSLLPLLQAIWLFHHITGLPVELYPERNPGPGQPPDPHPLETLFGWETVKITGDPDVVEHLNSVKD